MSSIRPFLRHFRSKLEGYKQIVHRLLSQDARIIMPEFTGTDSSLAVNTNNREKRGIFSNITGLGGLAYEGIIAYLS